MKWSLSIGLILIILFIGAGLVLTPYGLGHPTSNSMNPTITQEDVFIIGPVGDIETGDVIVFNTEGVDILTVHRVVGVTEEGFITRGDANAQTDQAVGIPPVSNEQIVGQAVSVEGHLITIPKTYRLISFIGSNAILIGALGALLLFVHFTKGRYGQRFDRPPLERPIESTDIAKIVPIAAIVTMTIFIILTPAVYSWSIVATNSGIADQTEINVPVGETVERQITFDRPRSSPFGRPIPEAIGGTVMGESRVEDELGVTIRVGPYAQPGHQNIDILFYRYPATLPDSWIRALHSIHPALAAFSTSSVVIGAFGLLFYLFVPNNVPLRLKGISRRLD